MIDISMFVYCVFLLLAIFLPRSLLCIFCRSFDLQRSMRECSKVTVPFLFHLIYVAILAYSHYSRKLNKSSRRMAICKGDNSVTPSDLGSSLAFSLLRIIISTYFCKQKLEIASFGTCEQTSLRVAE